MGAGNNKSNKAIKSKLINDTNDKSKVYFPDQSKIKPKIKLNNNTNNISVNNDNVVITKLNFDLDDIFSGIESNVTSLIFLNCNDEDFGIENTKRILNNKTFIKSIIFKNCKNLLLNYFQILFLSWLENVEINNSSLFSITFSDIITNSFANSLKILNTNVVLDFRLNEINSQIIKISLIKVNLNKEYLLNLSNILVYIPNLIFLDISSNKLNSYLSEFKLSASLKILVMNDCDINTVSLASFFTTNNINFLEKLSLENNFLNEDFLDLFLKLLSNSKLQTQFFLYNNEISGFDFKSFSFGIQSQLIFSHTILE